jgi:hypothetical protein
MTFTNYSVLALVALVFYVGSAIWRFRIQKGRWRTFSATGKAGTLGFESDFARFVLSPTKKTISIVGMEGPGSSLSFSEIKGLHTRVHSGPDCLREFRLPFDVLDPTISGNSVTDWHFLLLLDVTAKEIPIYVAGQYSGRDVILIGGMEPEKVLLGKLGLVPCVGDRVNSVRSELLDLFREAGKTEWHA